MEIEIESEKPEMEDKEYGKYEKYEIEDAVRTLQEAEMIKADAEKMKYVKMCMDKKMSAMKKASEGISSIADLKAVAKKKKGMAMEQEMPEEYDGE